MTQAVHELPTEAMLESTVDEIRQRFDADVERFSHLDTGQSTTVDAPLVARAALDDGRPDRLKGRFTAIQLPSNRPFRSNDCSAPLPQGFALG